MKCRKPYFQLAEASSSPSISREWCQYPPPEDSAPVSRCSREKTVTQPAGRLGQDNCCQGHHCHWRSSACCIVPLCEHCLITDTLNDVPAVTRCLRAGPPVPAPAWLHHSVGEVPDAHPAHHTLGANNLPSTFGSSLGLGALQLLPSALCQSMEFGQKTLLSLGWSAWWNNLLHLLWIQTWPLGFLFNRPEPRPDFQNSIPSCFPVIPPKWWTEPREQTLTVSGPKAPGASGNYFVHFQ